MAQHQIVKFKTKLYLGYASILMLMVLLSAIVYHSLSGFEEDRKWVTHTYQAIESIQNCGASMVNMETGVRGFLVAGNEEFLAPYEAGEKAFEEIWEYGRNLTSDNFSQTQRWDKLKSINEQWQKTVAIPEITMRREVREGQNALNKFQQLSVRKTGQEIFDKLRDHIQYLDYKFVHADRHDGADLITDILIDLLNQETGQRGFLLTGLEETLESFEQGVSDFEDHFKTLNSIDLKDTGVRSDEIAQIKIIVNEWHENAAFPGIEAMREVNKFPKRLNDVTALLEAGTGRRLMDEMRLIIDEMISEEKELLYTRSKNTESDSKISLTINVIGTIFAVTLGVFIAFFIVSSINRQLGTDPENLGKLADDLAVGDLSIDLSLEKKKASGVYQATIQMVENSKEIVQQAEAVSLGNYKKKIQLRSEKDQLGIALNRMTEKLKEASENNENGNFLKTGQAGLNERLRGEQSLFEITDNAIRFLSEYLKVQVGAFYLLKDEDTLELSASYAYQKHKHISEQFKVGEGLVGQVAREKKPMLISEVPEDYIQITSGLGKTFPCSILVYPVMNESELFGVIEFASIRMFTDLDSKLVDSVSRSVAIALNTAGSRDQMASLL